MAGHSVCGVGCGDPEDVCQDSEPSRDTTELGVRQAAREVVYRKDERAKMVLEKG